MKLVVILICLIVQNQILFTMATELKRVHYVIDEKVGGTVCAKLKQYIADEKIDVRGWCKTALRDNVLGEIEGEVDKVEIVKKWLKEENPGTDFFEKPVDTLTVEGFRLH